MMPEPLELRSLCESFDEKKEGKGIVRAKTPAVALSYLIMTINDGKCMAGGTRAETHEPEKC